MNYFPDAEQQAKNQILMEELKRENPSLFKRMMKAGMLAMLGAIAANLMDEDPAKGAATGAFASMFFPRPK